MTDGSLYCWGNNQYGQIGIGTNCEDNYLNGCNGNYGIPTPSEVSLPAGRPAEAVANGAYHACAILDNASLLCWGGNSNGSNQHQVD